MALPPATTQPFSDLAQVSVTSRIPDFWKEQPRIWFVQVEAVLAPQKLGDEARYNLVITKLDREAIAQVTDILMSPPSTDKYTALKNRLLEIYEESENRKIQKLIGEIELGDQKPSQLLRRMRDLARDRIPDATLQILWLQHLPSAVQAVLTVTEMKELDKLAGVADKVMETSTRRVYAVKADDASSSTAKLTAEIAKLNARLSRMESFNNRRSRSRTPSQNRRPSQQRQQPRQRDRKCFYHFRFGENAKKCIQPCSWVTKQNSEAPGN